MKIILTGSGSGGHVVPILSIIHILKEKYPTIEIIFVGQKGDNLTNLIRSNDEIDRYYFIHAGKFRRYSNEGWRQLLDLKTVYKNFRDLFLIFLGFIESIVIIRKNKPDRLFTRGGYIAVPIALAAKLTGLSYITHDSDVVPSLANKIIAPWAKYNLVALKKGYYPYDKNKIKVTGVPVSNQFKFVDHAQQIKFKLKLGLKSTDKVLFVIGGGLGSLNINKLILSIADKLLTDFDNLYIFHVVGQKNYHFMEHQYHRDIFKKFIDTKRIQFFSFLDEVYLYSGAADLIISRAGATNIAEFSLQGKACIVIPSPSLPNSHQLKNAQYLQDNQATIVLSEKELLKDPIELKEQVSLLLRANDRREELIKSISALANDQAIEKIISYIVD